MSAESMCRDGDARDHGPEVIKCDDEMTLAQRTSGSEIKAFQGVSEEWPGRPGLSNWIWTEV